MGQKDPLEKEMATHSNIFAWEISWTEEHDGLQSIGHKELDMTEMTEHNIRHCVMKYTKYFTYIKTFNFLTTY